MREPPARPFWYIRRRRGAVSPEVDEALAVHIEMKVDPLIADGLPAGEARRRALAEFGNIDAQEGRTTGATPLRAPARLDDARVVSADVRAGVSRRSTFATLRADALLALLRRDSLRLSLSLEVRLRGCAAMA